MTDKERLNELIEKSGLKKSFIYQRLGITRESFRLKIGGQRPFTVPEVDTLCELLGITSIEDMYEIFFQKKVDNIYDVSKVD